VIINKCMRDTPHTMGNVSAHYEDSEVPTCK
jgi:hypothetical protein